MAAGTVTGDASTGTDTLRSIKSVRGSAFADTYNATGFGAGWRVERRQQRKLQRVRRLGRQRHRGRQRQHAYQLHQRIRRRHRRSAGSGTVIGNASVGSDTVSGISQVRGSNFDDTIRGSGANDFFDGRAGNDLLDGRGGFDQAVYNADTLVTAGIIVDMAAGTVTGDATIGTDTLQFDRVRSPARISPISTTRQVSAMPARTPAAPASTAPSTCSRALAATTPSPATATPRSTTGMRRPRDG